MSKHRKRDVPLSTDAAMALGIAGLVLGTVGLAVTLSSAINASPGSSGLPTISTTNTRVLDVTAGDGHQVVTLEYVDVPLRVTGEPVAVGDIISVYCKPVPDCTITSRGEGA